MIKLFLCSYFAGVSALLPPFAGKKLEGKTVAFIPTASLHEPYKDYVKEGKEALLTLGLKVKELEVGNASKEEIAQTLDESDLIYVSGGNTFFLLQELMRKEADVLLTRQIKAGKLYIGESAGAMILSPNIGYAKEMDNAEEAAPQLRNFDALCLVNFYPLPHYKSFPFEELTDKILKNHSEIPFKPITNVQVICVNGDLVTVEEALKE